MDQSSALAWAEYELGGAQLNDKRRTKCLVETAAKKLLCPGKVHSALLGLNGEHRISRLFSCESVTASAILEPHRLRTQERCQQHKVVIGIQDTTYLNFSTHTALSGLGPIGSSKKEQGLVVHSSMIVTPGKTPLGFGGIQIWARSLEDFGISEQRWERDIEEKESNKWLIGHRSLERTVPDDVWLIEVCDREADIFELFAAARRINTDLVVRASQLKRLVSQGEVRSRLIDVLKRSAVLGQYTVDIPANGKHPAREAVMEVRVAKTRLLSPKNTPGGKRSVRVWVVWTYEINPPDEESALEWVIITTVKVKGFKKALEVIEYYSCRWTIEEFHKVLKSQTMVEKMQFDDLDSMEPAIAECAVVAQRIVHLTKTARENPDAPASDVASEMEVRVLESWLKRDRYKYPEILTVRDYVRGVAILGGFHARKCDGEPGAKTLGEGLRRLGDLVAGFSLSRRF